MSDITIADIKQAIALYDDECPVFVMSQDGNVLKFSIEHYTDNGDEGAELYFWLEEKEHK